MSELTLIDRGSYHLVVAPEYPSWAATNRLAAQLLQELAAGGPERLTTWVSDLAASDGLSLEEAWAVTEGCADECRSLWAPPTNGDYAGRSAYLRPQYLRELWLHIADCCNFSCRHCLVSSGPEGDRGLPTDVLLELLDQAKGLGVRTFFITGGEPLLRPDLPELMRVMLQDPDAQVVVLTNGSLLSDGWLAAVADLDRERLHLQVSLDGSTPTLNDALRAPEAFERATAGLSRAMAAGLEVTVATVVLEANLHDLPEMARLLARLGVCSWHLMWQHLRERGAQEPQAAVAAITAAVLAVRPVANALGVRIDNFDNYRAVLNGEPGTKREGTSAGWDSLAVAPDGGVYPSASLVGVESFRAGDVRQQTLREVWLQSPVLRQYRSQSLPQSVPLEADPFSFFHGGGDPEHAYFHSNGNSEPADPYLPLYREMLLALADELAGERLQLMGARDDVPFIYHVMGQDGLGCPVHAGIENSGPYRLDFARTNCVLTQDVVGHSRRVVQDYYGEAAIETKGEICCPIPVDRRLLSHVPRIVLERSYGCGSPVFAADLQPGETVVDLGSGGGKECFVAARLVGATGQALGVDMTPEMLDLANGARAEVAANLGYDNARFLHGYLENVPLADNSADVVISNCVINLSPEKYKVFGEILRILKPGGRMVISDITAAAELPEKIKYNPRLKGECLAGALTHKELLRLLSKIGFVEIELRSSLPWREIEGVSFLADTVVAVKPAPDSRVLPYVGATAALAAALTTAQPCSCSEEERSLSDCMVCGAPLQYLQTAISADCAQCGRSFRTRARCAEGHFVCDQCHGGDYLRFLQGYLAECTATDPVLAFLDMRNSWPFPVHGPEHHALVPAAFLIAYSNLHGYPDLPAIWEAVETGAGLAGGSCAFWGACSAVLGIGVAFSTILKATPTKGPQRGAVQAAVSEILGRVAAFNAPRCCRRESLMALTLACELSGKALPEALATSSELWCDQMWANDECLGQECPFAPGPDLSDPSRPRTPLSEEAEP